MINAIETHLIKKSDLSLKPFIRWAGGKQNSINAIIPHLPCIQPNQTYFEPFLGAGSIFLAGEFYRAFLSDINAELVNCYKCIKYDHTTIWVQLRCLSENFSPQKYYQIRDEFNSSLGNESSLQAARFIILVQSSFNGIFRVNKSGQYNVPFGKIKPSLPSKDLLCAISKKLEFVDLNCCSYSETLNYIKKGDFIYLDPPYPPLNKTSTFQHYTIDKFPLLEQERVAAFASDLSNAGVKVLISNADTSQIRNLYKGWDTVEIEIIRYVSCKSVRNKIKELLIKNY